MAITKHKRVILPEQASKLAKLPQWAQKMIHDQGREIESLKGLINDLHGKSKDRRYAYLEVRDPESPGKQKFFYLPQHVLWLSVWPETKEEITIRAEEKHGKRLVRVSSGGRSSQGGIIIVPDASNTVHIETREPGRLAVSHLS